MRTRGLVPFSATIVAALLAILLAAGCSGVQGSQQPLEDQQQREEELRQREEELQQREEELEQEREEDLQKQIDDLKAQQEEKLQQQQEPPPQEEPQVVVENNENVDSTPTPAPEGVVFVTPDVVADTDLEASALDAAISYYQAVEVGDYTYTYNALSSVDQDNFSYGQWLDANNSLDSAAAEFEVFRALVDGPGTEIVGGYPHVADVGVSIYFPDGSLSTRDTYFVYEGGVWKHWLTAEETNLFNSVL